MKFIFSRVSHKAVFCIRSRADQLGHDITVLPGKGFGYHLFPASDYLATCLLREVGLSELEAKRRAPLLAATPLLQRDPPWEVTESELRAFVSALEPFLQGGAS